MKISKIIKSNILYYYLTALVFTLLIVATFYIFPFDAMGNSSLNFYIILPVVSLILGFLAGGAKSYAKWGFPIYVALLSFCLSVLVNGVEDWILVLIGFVSALVGVAVRHGLKQRRRPGK